MCQISADLYETYAEIINDYMNIILYAKRFGSSFSGFSGFMDMKHDEIGLHGQLVDKAFLCSSQRKETFVKKKSAKNISFSDQSF